AVAVGGAPRHAAPAAPRLGRADREPAPRGRQQRPAAVVELPVEPGELVVLAVGVVVAALRAPELVAAAEHRHALRQRQRRDEVALLPLAQLLDAPIVGLALDAAVPGV